MYQQFYNFSAEPFRLSPDHNFAYAHKGYNKARAYLEYAFMRAEGFVMITGKPGTGKSTLVGALVNKLADSPVSVANLVCTQLQADDLLKMVAYEFGVPISVVEKGELLQRLTMQLKLWHRDNRRALLIVDEAQDLSLSAMEELRLLTNIQVDSRPLLQIFLLGQPELRKLILSRDMVQVHQRIIAASHIKPLDGDETEAYIRHRLKVVQWRQDPAISKPVYALVHKFSDGVPRRINLICSRLLLHCAVEQKHRVTVADMREVIEELQSEHLASGNSYAESDFQAKDVFDEVIVEPPAAQSAPVVADNAQEDADTLPPVTDLTPANIINTSGDNDDNYPDLPANEYAASERAVPPDSFEEGQTPALLPNLVRPKHSTSPWFLQVMLMDIVFLATVILIAVFLVTYDGWI